MSLIALNLYLLLLQTAQHISRYLQNKQIIQKKLILIYCNSLLPLYHFYSYIFQYPFVVPSFIVCNTAVSIAVCRAILIDSFLTKPFSISTSSVESVINLNTSWSIDALNIVLVTRTSSSTLPVLTETVRKDMVTVSCLYCLDIPIPRYLAPAPPDFTLLSYDITPPCIIKPANIKGWSFVSSLNSCLVLRIIWRSLVTLSKPTRSTT